MTSPAEHAATVLEVLSDEATSPHPDDWGGTRAKARDSLAALVAQAERATDIDSRVEALMTELERGYILRSTHDSIVQGLADRATELERDLDEYRAANRHGIAGLMREKRAAEARAEQLEREKADLQYRLVEAEQWRERAEQLESELATATTTAEFAIRRCEQLERDLADARSVTYSGLVTRTLQRAEQLETALRTIKAWDCLNPPATDLCADFPWLKQLVDAALDGGTATP